LAHPLRQAPPALGRPKGTVEQEHAPLHQARKEVEALEELPVVAGHQGGALDQVAGADRPRPKAQVRHRERTRFLRVVDEIALGIQGRVFADDRDRVFVGADRAIGAEAIDHRPHFRRGPGP
jgi:hypothetical protein